jgi:hypothetical protein
MEVVKCDVCGLIFNDQKGVDEGSAEFWFLKKVDPDGTQDWKRTDLCPTCGAAVNEFIEKRRGA